MALHRRELLLVGAGLVVAKATASTLACAKETTVNEEDPEKKDDKGAAKAKKAEGGKAEGGKAEKGPDAHAGHEGHEGHAGAGGSANAAFAAASADCVEKGDACLQHCIASLSKGDTSMAECAAAVNDMLAVCRGMGTLALSGSKHLKAAAQLCIDVCTDCAAACEPHAAHHESCKACHEACVRSIDEAKKLVG